MKNFTTFEELFNLAPKGVQELLNGLKDMRERPDYHPEESAFIHVKIVTERLMQTGDIDLILAGLFHDITKKVDMKINKKTGWPTSPGHDKHGAEVARSNSDFIKSLGGDVENVATICAEHMRMKQMSQMRKQKQEVLRSLPVFDKLEIFTRADNMLAEFTL